MKLRNKSLTASLIAVPILKNANTHQQGEVVDAQLRADEICRLAEAIDLEIKAVEIIKLSTARASSLIGSGKLQQLASLIEQHDIKLMVVDHNLTPIQQYNLEKKLNLKVIDRTALILEIFGARAKTKEGALQVELAHLTYQKSRLIRSWTHLERQRGGTSFIGGPGEKQIEADRRHLQSKINHLKKQLELVVKTRRLHRVKRQKVPYPIIALVGYTNAGKSTLFNSLTGANILAKDMLFATLDPTLRQVKLQGGNVILFSDTVGFIANLPIHLVAAFRATLEEVCEADLILHVRDISNPQHHLHKIEVLKTLKYLDVDSDIIEVWNKIDLLSEEDKKYYLASAASYNEPVFPISALKEQNLSDLLQFIEQRLFGKLVKCHIILDNISLSKIDLIYKYGLNISRKNLDSGNIEIKGDFHYVNLSQLKQNNIKFSIISGEE